MGENTETENTMHHAWPGSDDVKIALKVSKPHDKHEGGLNFIWLGGFKSDMNGTKADVMVAHAATLNCSSLRFDYSGHGDSSGDFVLGTISRWVDESLNVLLNFTSGPQILVGSSMGGWIALRLVQELAKRGESDRIAGLLLVAPAPDFTSELMEPEFTAEQRTELEKQGFIEEPSEYSDEPNIITRALIEDGRKNRVLNSDFTLNAPVRILQGMADPDVPYQHALRLMESLPHEDATITLIKDGDHRLSRTNDLSLLKKTMDAMVDCHNNTA